MAKGSRGDFATRDVRIRQALQTRAVAEIPIQVFVAYHACLIQAGVLGHDPVALAEHEVIAIVGRRACARLGAEVTTVQDGEDLDDGEGATDVHAGSSVGHA